MGLGGGAFLLHWSEKARRVRTYDARETAPAAAKADRFLDRHGNPEEFLRAVTSGRAVGVPGVPRLLEVLHREHGRLPWARLFEPALRLAEGGFQQTRRLARMLERYPDVQALFPLNREYAATLRALAAKGADAFYGGPIAEDIVRAARSDLALEDLARYRVIEREPVCGAYRGYRVCGMGPPSSGGVGVLQILGLLERTGFGAAKPHSAEAVHLFSEAARLAYVRFWRSLPATSALYAAFAVHIGLAFMSLYERHTLRMPVAEFLRLALGFSIPFLLVAHFTGTRLGFELYGQDDPYARVVWALWSNDRGLRQLALITIAWTHGCLGLHFLLRHRAFYRTWSHVFFAAAVLVPALGHLGFLAMAAEIDARQAAVLSGLNPAQSAFLGQIRDGILVLFGSLLGSVLAARALRSWHKQRRGLSIALRYPGQVVRVPRGWSVLEASRANGIPHLSLCGGRARCSTCRVRVEGPAESLPPPGADEARTLARVGAEAGVRLACQLRPRGDVAVTPLLRPAQPGAGDVGLMSGLERDLAILFIDLRRWTGLAERQFPHDLFYVQELFFEAVGDAVREAGGVPNQFIGDSVMAIFGAEGEPGAHSEKTAEQAARQALAAARGIEARMAALNERLAREFGHRFGFGIGIHSGPAALGEVGYRDTRTLSAVGDTVNTASRLQELTKQYGVPLVVSERVALAAGLDVAGLEAKELPIRGRANTLRIYALASIAQSGA